MRTLLTGGTGHLGRSVVAQLLSAGHAVRVLARRPGDSARVEWARGDLATGEGLENAVTGVDAVIHAATHSPIAQRGAFRPLDFIRSPTDVDVAGTQALLHLAARAAIHHFVHISIVGLEQTAGLPYSRVKLTAERLVRESSVPWTIVRATGFYWLLDKLFDRMSAHRLAWIPAEVKMQPVDSDDFARFVFECATADERGEREDFAGPEVLTMRELCENYLAARGRRTKILSVPLPQRMRLAMEAGQVAPNARRGSTTWGDWLRAHVARAA